MNDLRLRRTLVITIDGSADQINPLVTELVTATGPVLDKAHAARFRVTTSFGMDYLNDAGTVITGNIAEALRRHRRTIDGGRLQPPADVEALAALAHAAWVDHMQRTGIASRPGVTGEETLKPYAELSETEKAQPRAVVRALLTALSP